MMISMRDIPMDFWGFDCQKIHDPITGKVEASGIQALERAQPMLPLGLGYVEGMTHDYRRHGTTTLFAALDAANGKVLTPCRPRHRHQEYLSFLREIEKNVPENLDVHIIVDNYATHKHLRVRRWFATRPRF